MRTTTRRYFLQQGALVGGALALGSRALGATSANEQVNLGIVGLGWRGGQLIDAFGQVPGVKIAAICDPDSALVDEWSAKVPDAQTFSDLRGLLDLAELDAVAIATCNHWHCLAALWAMEAGKHVYVEKPLCNAHWEGVQVVNATDKYQKICQIGTQQRSAPMQAEIKQILHEDKLLGPIEWVRVNRYGVRASIGKRDTPLAPPATLDYNVWLGPAADQPIYRDNWHYDWHWDWNTGAGEMGNWGVHLLDDVRNNVFRDSVAFPQRVVAAGGRFGWHDAGNTPNVHFALLDTGTIPVVIALTNLPEKAGSESSPKCPGPGSGYIAYCEGGRLEGQRGSAKVFDAEGKLIKDIESPDGMVLHQKNFIDAVRNHSPGSLNAPVKEGHHSTAWCNMANYAYRAAQESAASGPTNPTKAIERLGAGAGLTASAATILEQLSRVAANNEPGTSVEEFSLGPVLTFDGESEQFTGAHAETANQYLRTMGRGEFMVKEV
ncbi:Gfo/Idh/MocA family protein [Bythopirellula polymerisocia]|uniref:Glycosyl hydrolase n=1 Tax=Bythopirellula polymerisocia TaxID=2528003 RepID=A0A5C6D1Z5_9BACT|nr:Gfo/Idh/MocA family oxidoreductase [Bythopirellula polymerisocia]TWU29864.1 Glycosyl hydrolase [Bythopirellula polymerisocia]